MEGGREKERENYGRRKVGREKESEKHLMGAREGEKKRERK